MRRTRLSKCFRSRGISHPGSPMPLYASKRQQFSKREKRRRRKRWPEVEQKACGNLLNSTEATVPHISTTLMPINISSARILHDANREAYTRSAKTADASMPNASETAGSNARHLSATGESGISVGDVWFQCRWTMLSARCLLIACVSN